MMAANFGIVKSKVCYAPRMLQVQEGQCFERLTVVTPETRKNGRRAAACRCSCGTESVLVYLSHLTSGRVRSCGCLKREETANRNKATARWGGATNSPLFSHWGGMMNRCYNPAAANYRWYGARGISVWEPWQQNPVAFIDWVEQNLGPCPGPGYSLDRTDNDGDYEPGNLNWATAREQARNRRKRKGLT